MVNNLNLVSNDVEIEAVVAIDTALEYGNELLNSLEKLEERVKSEISKSKSRLEQGQFFGELQTEVRLLAPNQEVCGIVIDFKTSKSERTKTEIKKELWLEGKGQDDVIITIISSISKGKLSRGEKIKVKYRYVDAQEYRNFYSRTINTPQEVVISGLQKINSEMKRTITLIENREWF